MKHLLKSLLLKRTFLSLALMITYTIIRAQDSAMQTTSTTTSTTTTEQHTWYAEPWVWVVGGIVLLLVIIALVKGNGSTEKVTVTKTTTVD